MPVNSIEIRNILRQPEGPKLDFKQEFYAISSKGEDRQWGELIKDILSLANGNIGYATQPGYLIIGPEDKQDAAGNRKLHSTESTLVNISQIQDKVNSACRPSIPNIELERIKIENDQIIIIFIGPSPYLYEITRDIKTNGAPYHKGSILIREGSEVKVASFEEINAIKNEKHIAFNILQIQSEIERRIDNAQKELHRKQGEYENIRSKLDINQKEHYRLYHLRQSIELDTVLIYFLRMKKKLEKELHLNYYTPLYNLGNKCFDYAIKLMKEKIPKIPPDHPYSKQLIEDIRNDVIDKLDIAIESGYKNHLLIII